jgi:putative peptidoglycan lipid II flippase
MLLSMNTRNEAIVSIAWGTVIIGTLLGSCLGFFREVLYANYFGTSNVFDAFALAMNWIQVIAYSILSVIPLLLIPDLAAFRNSHEKESNSRYVLTASVVLASTSIILILLMEIFGYWFIRIIGPGFTDTKFESALLFLRIGAPMILFMTGTAITRSILNVHKIFFLPSLEALFINATIIGIVFIVFALSFRISVIYVFIGYFLGYGIFVSLSVRRTFRFVNLLTEIDWQYAFHFCKRLAVAAGATLIFMINSTVILGNASFLGEGAVSAINYAHRLLVFSLGTIVNALLVVSFPQLSSDLAKGRSDTMRNRSQATIEVMFIISAFIAAFLVLNGPALVRLLFERGKFTTQSTAMVSELLLYYILWVVFYPLSAILTRLIYVYKDLKAFCLISALGLSFNMAAAPILRSLMGLNGLGAAAGLHQAIHTGMLCGWLFYKRGMKFDWKRMFQRILPGIGTISFILVTFKFLGRFYPFFFNRDHNIVFIVASFLLLASLCYAFLRKMNWPANQSHMIKGLEDDR